MEIFYLNILNTGTLISEEGKIDYKLLEKKLRKAETEVELLQQDLDLCQRQLEAKYKAIRIMQKQVTRLQQWFICHKTTSQLS